MNILERYMVFGQTFILLVRRSIFLLIFFFALSGLLLNRSAWANRPVKIGIYDNKPLVFLDDDGRPDGIFIDLLRYIASRERWDISFVHGTWVDCLDRLESGQIDLLAAIAYSKDRAKKFNFTHQTVLTNWGQVFDTEDSKIVSVLDLDGKKIGVKMEDIHFHRFRELITKFNMNCRFIEAEDYDTVFEMVAAGRVAAGVVNRLYGIQNKGSFRAHETPVMFNPIEVRFATPKKTNTDLLAAIDKHLSRMHAAQDSFLHQTINNWLVAPTEWILPDAIRYLIIGAGLLALFFSAMTATLRIKVKKRTNELSCTNEKLKEEMRIREKAEEGLRKYETIVSSSTDFMALVDLSYRVQAINDASLLAFGRSRESVIGKTILQVIDESLSAEIRLYHFDRAFAGQVVKLREWLDFPELGKRYVDIVFTPYRQSNKDIAGCVVISRDITERHELENRLENAQKMELMGTIAGGVAHDLNNILSAIVSYPELLLLQLPQDSLIREPLETIKKSGERAAVIVQDLLTLTRRGVTNIQIVDLNDIIDSFVKSPEWEKIRTFHPNVRIHTHLADAPIPINGSAVHLSKTIMNLVSNAAEAMPDGGGISISTKILDLDPSMIASDNIIPGKNVLLKVSDEGMGISKDDLKKIFDPFYTKKAMGRSGTGLGLAVVWGTVMDHHGHIEVESNGQTGSTFRLYFPVSDEPVQSTERDMEPFHYKGNGETILIVDDVKEQREIATNILTELGYAVVTADSGEDAISYLRETAVDLVILDMLMPPGMDGLTTYEEILKIRFGQKAIIASGFAETERVRMALDMGVGHFVKKPYAIRDLGYALKIALMETPN